MQQDVKDIKLELIDEPPQAMRTEIPRDAIFDLAHDIKKNGLINPITVRPVGNRYEVVAGHRRFLAHRYGGIATIRCVVRELTDDEAFGVMTSENLARENVNPVDEAIHTSRMMEIHKGDIEKVRDILNRSKTWVEQRLVIAAMSDELKQELRSGNIKIGVALALTQITDPTDQLACLQLAKSQGASITVVNYWIAQWHAGLFGHANEITVPDSNVPRGERTVVMLKCEIDGKDHDCAEMISVLVARSNLGYIQALREHLKRTEEQDAKMPGEREALDAADMEDDDGHDAENGAANAQGGRAMSNATVEE
jgi:ParB/RepB/Spo0J family partition protein